MDIQTCLMQKNGLVAMKLAREFMTMQPGSRIRTIEEYSQTYETARGTVQAALKLLQQHQALQLEARGHLGTFLAMVNYDALWEFTGLGTLMGVMPLPYSKRYEGLASGLYNRLQSKKIPFSLAYMRGAQARLKALQEGRYDFAVVSRLAAMTACANGQELESVLAFGPHSYVNEHVLIFADTAKRSIEDGMRVGIDYASIDHALLTKAQCDGKDVGFVALPYNQLISKLQAGDIDAAVWNVDEIIEHKLPILYYPLVMGAYQGLDHEAVIVAKQTQHGVGNLLRYSIDSTSVLEHQQQVMRGEVIPNY